MPRIAVRFGDKLNPGETELARFSDPSPAVAAVGAEPADFVINLLSTEHSGDFPAAGTYDVYVKVRGAELLWSRTQATLRCEESSAGAVVDAVVSFTHYERELRRLEQDIAGSWDELDEDRHVVFAATPATLKRSDELGARTEETFARRARLARLEPHLYSPPLDSSALPHKLGEELRDKLDVETRLEIADGQLEVYEHVYEMASQRLGEFRASHGEHVLEWIIIVLLAVEVVATFLHSSH